MKKLFIILFLFISLSGFSQNGPGENFLEKISSSEAGKYFNLKNFKSAETGNEYDLKYHRLYWEVDPDIRYIKGEVSSVFIVSGAGTDKLTFDLDEELTVDSVYYHANKIVFSHNNDILEITLPEYVNGGVTDSLLIFYQGIPVEDDSYTFSLDEHNGIPVMWTLSEPYGAKDWWPCKQNLNDKIDSVDIYVNAPSDYKVAGNGILISEIENKLRKTTHWKHNHPVAAYLIAFAVTNYDSFSNWVELNSGKNLEVLNYVYPEDKNKWMEDSEHIASMIRLFSELFIEYPFSDEKYGHAQFGWGGGMEHQTMSFMGSLEFELMSHELAHQWFGNYVTCGNWQNIWLNEGFATFLSGLCFKYLLDGVWWPVWKRLNIERVTREPDGSVFLADTTDEARMFDSRLSYSKGALVLNMLRYEIGDDNFYQSVKNYLNDPQIRNAYAYTPQLIAHFEQEADTSLTEFFNDWLYGEGYPRFTIEYLQNISGTVNLTLNQFPTHQSVDFFEITVPISFQGINNDTIIYFHNTHSDQTFEFFLNFEISDIMLDPDYHIITSNPVINIIDEIKISDEVIIYPNPVSNIINIKPANNNPVNIIEIFNMNGSLIKSYRPGNSQTIKIDVSSFISGSYYLKIDNSRLRKILIIKKK